MRSLRIDHIRSAAYIWAAFPVLLFLLFWFRWYYAVPLSAMFIFASVKAIRAMRIEDPQPADRLPLDYRVVLALCFVLLWLIAIGVGGLLGQEYHDNGYRNAVLYELVHSSWPVVDTEFVPGAYMSYYFAYWLPAAIPGKFFGSYDLAQLMLLLYSFAGLSTLVLMVMHYCKRRYLLAGVLVFLVGGLDFANVIVFCRWLGWHSFTSVGGLLFGAPTLPYLGTYIYNQGFPCWIILMLMYGVRNRTDILMILFVPLLLMAPFAAIVVAPVLGFVLLRRFRCAFSVVNAVGVLICLFIALFFTGNDRSAALVLIFSSDIVPWQMFWLAVGCLVFNFGVFMPFVWSRIKGDPIFWSLLFFTMCACLICTEDWNYDFGWKSPMVLTGYFYLQLIRYCAEADWKKGRNRLLAAMLVATALLNEASGIKIAQRAYHLVKQSDNALCLLRADWLCGKLFNPGSRGNPCYTNFVTANPTIYSKYFAPECVSKAAEREKTAVE